jgi:hypothetical protein
MAVAQVWRDEHARQARLARLLRAVDVRPVADRDGRAAEVLPRKCGTSDPNELRSLADAANSRALIVSS